VDNSEFTRNGDYAPTRFQAQADAVNLLAGAKTQHHPENTVGVLTMAGKTPQVGARVHRSALPPQPHLPYQQTAVQRQPRLSLRPSRLPTQPAPVLVLYTGRAAMCCAPPCLLQPTPAVPGPLVQVLVTPTPDLGKVLNAMQEMRIEGDVNLATSVQIAQLALKHRQNKNQRQRVVIFVGSPIAEDKASLLVSCLCRGRDGLFGMSVLAALLPLLAPRSPGMAVPTPRSCLPSPSGHALPRAPLPLLAPLLIAPPAVRHVRHRRTRWSRLPRS
jgi:hypothetical protein